MSIYQRIGILGGGQLGRMLIQEAINYNLDIKVMDPDQNAPCRHLCKSFTHGALTDFDTVYQFGKDCDVITIEIEHVNTDALKKLEQEGKHVYPQPHIIELIQDKGLQKLFYQEKGIPSPAFVLTQNREEVKQLWKGKAFAHKLRKGGYDGKGVQLIKTDADLDLAFDAPGVLEELVDLQSEIAVIVARNASGQISHFPPVEMEFNPQANLVEFLVSPAHLSPEQEKEAISIAEKVIKELGIVGLLAVELFLDKNGKIWVNEVAPRPHNSGHQSIEGNYTSQYEQHLRAILDLPLGDTAIIQPSVMINVLGEAGYTGRAIYQGIAEIMNESGVYVHLYGKTETKPFRKMGHITVMGTDREQVIAKARKIVKTLKVIA